MGLSIEFRIDPTFQDEPHLRLRASSSAGGDLHAYIVGSLPIVKRLHAAYPLGAVGIGHGLVVQEDALAIPVRHRGFFTIERTDRMC